MGIDFSKILVIGISSRALFDLESENEIFEKEGQERYNEYQVKNENTPLQKGVGFHLVESLLRLNALSDERVVEVVVVSRNTPEAWVRILNAIETYGLDISRSIFTWGGSPVGYITSFNVDLFLSKYIDDVQKVIDSQTSAAAVIYNQPECVQTSDSQVRIAFDADAVLFSDDSERIFQSEGIDAFMKHETEKRFVPMEEWPFGKFIKTLGYIQKNIDPHHTHIRTAIVTARNAPAHLRVMHTLRHWGVSVDEAIFLGGASKAEVLEAFQPHIFFDDQELHLKWASKVVPSSQVPHKTRI